MAAFPSLEIKKDLAIVQVPLSSLAMSRNRCASGF
jgi:hypothetical protein